METVRETCQGLDQRRRHAQGPGTLYIPRGTLWSDLAAGSGDCPLPGRATRHCPHPEVGLTPLQAEAATLDSCDLAVPECWEYVSVQPSYTFM